MQRTTLDRCAHRWVQGAMRVIAMVLFALVVVVVVVVLVVAIMIVAMPARKRKRCAR
jgi:hypothetical protein